MKKLMLFAVLFSMAFATQAQLKFGIKGGLSTSDIKPMELFTGQELNLDLKEAGYGLHFGAFVRAQAGPIFIQPEALFNSFNAEYEISDISGSTVFKESYKNLDVPVIIGLKFGPLRMGAGPVAHINLDRSTTLSDEPNIDDNFEKTSFGYQAGIGLDIWKLNFDVRYEGNFNNVGDHISVGGTDINVGDKPNRILVSMGITF